MSTGNDLLSTSRPNWSTFVAPASVALAILLMWQAVCHGQAIPESVLPTPAQVGLALREEFASGRLARDVGVSMGRVLVGYVLAVVFGVPSGLLLGGIPVLRAAFLPVLNFLRCLSPITWIPFAILWFGVGHAPVIFLIFMGASFPMVLATCVATTRIPTIYGRIAREFGLRGLSRWSWMVLPAVLPDVLAAMRVSIGVAWLVLVAAEMVAGQDGLGFAIWDARNGLRPDLLIAEMFVIGGIGIILDRSLATLARHPFVRWGHER